MSIESINRNFEGINLYSKNKPFNEVPKKSPIDNFDTVQYTSRKDGKTYIAKKYTLKQDGKSITGVFVAEKGTKADENGKINGQFMSFETFLETMVDALPSVDANLMSSYYPNIHKSQNIDELDESYPLEGDIDFQTPDEIDETYPLEEEFMLANVDAENVLKEILDSGVKLPDNSVLLKKHQEGGAIYQISSNQDGTYDVTSRAAAYGSKPTTRTMTIADLITNDSLFGGSIKQLENGNYELRYKGESGNLITEEAIPVVALDFVKNSNLYSVYKDNN